MCWKNVLNVCCEVCFSVVRLSGANNGERGETTTKVHSWTLHPSPLFGAHLWRQSCPRGSEGINGEIPATHTQDIRSTWGTGEILVCELSESICKTTYELPISTYTLNCKTKFTIWRWSLRSVVSVWKRSSRNWVYSSVFDAHDAPQAPASYCVPGLKPSSLYDDRCSFHNVTYETLD